MVEFTYPLTTALTVCASNFVFVKSTSQSFVRKRRISALITCWAVCPGPLSSLYAAFAVTVSAAGDLKGVAEYEETDGTLTLKYLRRLFDEFALVSSPPLQNRPPLHSAYAKPEVRSSSHNFTHKLDSLCCDFAVARSSIHAVWEIPTLNIIQVQQTR